MHKTTKLFIGVVMVALVIWGGYVANNSKSSQATSESIKVGGLYVLSGITSDIGIASGAGSI
ncbi:MAG: hypothetical protein UX58_C0012G0008 [Candidatus Wolfebacteria bacterium GW2011_GWB2_46_69]|nr:MAG: hypothetical protein UX58_C0012G0008 [Candidatus Wolfebacteria bacterium GW2011_GWB2_46_69]